MSTSLQELSTALAGIAAGLAPSLVSVASRRIGRGRVVEVVAARTLQQVALVSSTTNPFRDRLLRSFSGNGILTPAITLMTARTCARSAAPAGANANAPIRAVESASVLNVCVMRDPFTNGEEHFTARSTLRHS
jgi:hypothetical protein